MLRCGLAMRKGKRKNRDRPEGHQTRTLRICMLQRSGKRHTAARRHELRGGTGAETTSADNRYRKASRDDLQAAAQTEKVDDASCKLKPTHPIMAGTTVVG